MLPLIPLMIAMTILISASLLIAVPSGTQQATLSLVDDMLRHHQAVSLAVDEVVSKAQPLDGALVAQQDNLDRGPFRPLFG